MARPEKLDRIVPLLDAMVTTPEISVAARRVGLGVATVFRYLVRSRMGDPALQEIEWMGVAAPFHIHVTQNARALTAQAIQSSAMDRALNGVWVDVFYQGQRQYERVLKREYEGFTNAELDEFGHNVDDCYEMRPVKQWLKPSDALTIKMMESLGSPLRSAPNNRRAIWRRAAHRATERTDDQDHRGETDLR